MSKIACIDFDGTIVTHAYPSIGEPLEGAFSTLKELKNMGWKLILFTCREDDRLRSYLQEAVDFCQENGVEFDAVNESIPEEEFRHPDCLNRKPYANVYIDDRMVGGLPSWDSIRRVLAYEHDVQWITTPKQDRREDAAVHQYYKLGETWKAHDRRLAEGWFDKYAPADKSGIDIGCQYDCLNNTFRRWDFAFGDGDAELMEGVEDETFHTVYASHILEHINNPKRALENWFRILKPGGHLIVVVPHRDLYEKRKTLPSQWNGEHKWFWLPEESEKPCTISLKDLIENSIPEGEIIKLSVESEGYDHSLPVNAHPVGEFSIEAIVRKN